MTNLITLIVLVLIVGGASLYIYKARKRGTKCIGCPSGSACAARGGESGCNGCSGQCGVK